jgi:hypothetical protein
MSVSISKSAICLTPVLTFNWHFVLLTYAKLYLFPDDTLLYIAADNLEEAVNKMNADLSSLSNWLNLNKLKLNIEKTKYMIITFKKNINTNLYKIMIGADELKILNT